MEIYILVKVKDFDSIILELPDVKSKYSSCDKQEIFKDKIDSDAKYYLFSWFVEEINKSLDFVLGIAKSLSSYEIIIVTDKVNIDKRDSDYLSYTDKLNIDLEKI